MLLQPIIYYISRKPVWCFFLTTISLRKITLDYKKLAKIYHPDKFNYDRDFTEEEGNETFKHILHAYED